MRRREFLRVASGAAGATAVGSGAAVAQEGTPTADGNETATAEGEPAGDGASVEVRLVDFAYEPSTEEPLVIPPGTTVEFVWETSNHNIVVESKPDESDWEGHEPLEDEGFTYEHTFQAVGDYRYFCQPHRGLGMIGDITVEEGAPVPGGEAAAGGEHAELDPEEMGVPFQAHYVGIATVLMIVMSLAFTFYLLKYGETPHSGYPRR